MRTFSIPEIKEHILKDAYDSWLDEGQTSQEVIIPDNIKMLFNHLIDGKEVPAFGVFEDERGYLKFKTANILYVFHLINAKLNDVSLMPLSIRKIQTLRIPVVISRDTDYLDLFL